MRGKKIVALILCFLCSVYSSKLVYASSQEEWLQEYDFSQLETELRKQDQQEVKFGVIVEKIAKGEIIESVMLVGKGMLSQVLSELISHKKIVIQIICVVVFSAIFTNFSEAFSSKQVGETGFFVTYLILFSMLATSYGLAVQITEQAVNRLLEFMKLLIPTFCMAITTTSGVTSSAGIYGILMLAVMSANYLVLTLLLPFTNLYFALQMMDYIGKERRFSKLSSLIKKGIEWGLRTIFVGIVGVQVLQGLILPAIDSVKGSLIQKGVSVIPGAGQAVSAILNTMLGAGVIIKNSIGVAGLLCILLFIGVPVLKLVLFSVSYQLLSAVLQPISDKRVNDCIQSTGEATGLLLRIVFVIAALFMVSLALSAAATNTLYYSQT